MTTDRQALVARKGEIQATLNRVQRELAHAEAQAAALTGLRGKLAARRLGQGSIGLPLAPLGIALHRVRGSGLP